MLLSFILIQKNLCYFSEISTGSKNLPEDSIVMVKELSFETFFWYESKKWPYLIYFRQNQIEKDEICSLVLALPFSNNKIRNNQINMEKDKLSVLLKRFFTTNYSQFFKTFWLVRIFYKEGEYLSFKAFEDVEIVLNLSTNKLYSYSNFNILEFTAG